MEILSSVQKVQNLVFPDKIYHDGKKRGVWTLERNHAIFITGLIISNYRIIYKEEKEKSGGLSTKKKLIVAFSVIGGFIIVVIIVFIIYLFTCKPVFDYMDLKDIGPDNKVPVNE